MSWYSIFAALETAIGANTTLQNFNIFRFESEANANQQSGGSVPFVKIWFKRSQSTKTDRHKLQNQVYLGVEIRWALTKSDKNAVERIQEFAAYEAALKDCLFGSNNAFLDREDILDMQVNSEPGDLPGSEGLKHGRILMELGIEYIETF